MDNVVYVTRDIERALGIPRETPARHQPALQALAGGPGYFIITNEAPFVKEGERLDTHELLALPATAEFIQKLRKPKILVFKNTPQIERICEAKNWRLLNPSAALGNLVEEKISQVEWLGELARFLPPHQILLCKDIQFTGEPFVLQFNRAHTGLGTIHIKTEGDLERVKKQFPDRPARVTTFISGPVFTNNTVVAKDAILFGNISYQITGLSPFTNNPFATIGNDWGFAKRALSREQTERFHEIARAVGEKLRKDGWKGLFGIDVIVDERNGQLFLLEINARQPASTTYESQLQHEARSMKHEARLTTFEAHLAALLGEPLVNYSLIPIDDGAQIFLRNADGDIVQRFQSRESLIAADGQLNERGQDISNTIH